MLYLVPTPIGNLGDLTQRALDVLKSADVVAAEDTRRTRQLLTHFGIPRPERLVVYREHREESAGRFILDLVRQGKTVALCTDGGFPGISDPGYRIVTAAIEAGLPFNVLPGPSAVPVALVSSGLPTSSFTFKGYPPRRGGPRRRFLEADKDSPHTLVLFESPFRVTSTLEAALEILGNRRAAVCLELTKKFESVTRGTLEELVARFRDRTVKGEATVVIEGNRDRSADEAEVTEGPEGQEKDDQSAEMREGSDA
jgi:16S rRNA (cytidine1402-2'-O)-methyltransferase